MTTKGGDRQMEKGLTLAPQLDQAIISLADQATKFLEYAEKRQVTDAEGVKEAARDLGLIANTKKAIEEKRKEFVGPLNEQVKEINEFFKTLSGPITVADQATRSKVLFYNAKVERKRQAAEEIEQEKLRLAQKEGALTGEHTVDLSPVEKPEATPDHVRTEVGTTNKIVVWKYEVTDFALLPDEYKVVDTAMLNATVKKNHDAKQIPGVRIYAEDSLQVRSS